ncbi:MAG TPA: protease inhibitor I42 family protein [Rugosimonospora sp.]|nr:protease inhibitor I42 family protein [Rugosimonospora sp.]
MPIRVGEPDAGGEVALAPDGVLEIALPENASTGYRWELEPLPPGAEQVGDRMEAAASAPPGAAGLRVFAVRFSGGGTVSARLRRPWEQVEPVRRFSVRVSAPAAGTPR